MSSSSTKKLSKVLDIYRKIDPELTRTTPLGAFLSLCGIIIMLCLFALELKDYLTPQITSKVMMDPGGDEEEIRMNFNISIERVACPYILIELQNQMGTHMLNISQNVGRFKIKTKNDLTHTLGKMSSNEPRRVLIGEPSADVIRDEDIRPFVLTKANFEEYISSHDVVLVNFFAPWCVWSKRLEPLWVAAAHDFSKDFGPNQIGVAWVDCTKSDQVDLCHSNHIQAFPTIVSFKGGDSHSADHYHEDRTMEAFKDYATQELTKVRKPPTEIHPGERALQAIELADKMDGDGKYSPAVEGCRLEGFILAPKVPGTLTFATQSHGQSVDSAKLNVSHEIHHLSFGNPLTKKDLAHLPVEVSQAVHKLDGKRFESRQANLTHEHFVKIVGSTFNFYNHGSLSYYKYLHYSSPFHASITLRPTIRMHFDMTPMHVVVDEQSKPFYRFITNLFAIIGGTFTVFGLLDSLLDGAHQALKKKIELGKVS